MSSLSPLKYFRVTQSQSSKCQSGRKCVVIVTIQILVVVLALTFEFALVLALALASASALTRLCVFLENRLELKIEEYPGQLTRACVELAKNWRMDKYLRRLDAVMLVADKVCCVAVGKGVPKIHFCPFLSLRVCPSVPLSSRNFCSHPTTFVH